MSEKRAEDSLGAPGSALAPRRSPYLDAAVIVGVCYALMYALGWIYWQSYYGELGIDKSFVDLTAEKVVATTWPVLFIAVFGVAVAFILAELDRYEGRLKNPGDFSQRVVFFSVISVLFLVLQWAGAPVWAYMVTVAAAVVALGVLTRAKWNASPLERLRGSAHLIFVVAVFAVVLLLVLYAVKGEHDGRKIRAGEAREIRLHIDGQTELPTEGLLIGHMDGKYFVWGRARAEQRMRTYIIDDSLVRSAEILPGGGEGEEKAEGTR